MSTKASRSYVSCTATDHVGGRLGVVPNEVVQPRDRRLVAERAVWAGEVVAPEKGR